MKDKKATKMINELTKNIIEKKEEIDKWFSDKDKIIPPIYSSFDIRNSGYKAAVIDSNVFPAGFNNLCSESYPIASKQIKSFIEDVYPGTNKIGLAAEYVKNPYYYDNILAIRQIVLEAGFDVKIGSFGLSDKANVSSFSKGKLDLNTINKEGDKLSFDGFIPDLILLNDDFSITNPALLEDCSQHIAPGVNLGWFQRKKHKHFEIKNKLVKEMSNLLNVDRWAIGAYFEFVDNVNFKKMENFDEIAGKVDSTISQIQGKYDEYGIKDDPFVFVKGNSSTYGMNAINFHSGKEFLRINSDKRAKMHKSKGGKIVSEVMIQEGIVTKDRIKSIVSEPVVYCIGNLPIGGFFRANPERSEKENLNSRGMIFSTHLFCPDAFNNKEQLEKSNITEDKIELYKFLAKIGTLAIGYELEELK